MIGRAPQPGDWVGQVVEDPVEKRHVEHRESALRERGQVESGELYVLTREVFGQEPRLPDPMLADVEAEAAAGAEAGGGEEVAAGVARAVQHRPAGETLGVDCLDEFRQGLVGPNHTGRAEFGRVGAGRRGADGADSGRDLDIMMPGAETKDLVVEFLRTH